MDPKKWILITGASTGIGRATTEYLASHGFNIYAGARKQADLDDLAQIPHVIPLKLDVISHEDVQMAVQRIKEQKTGLYALFNNAGIAIAGPTVDIPVEDFQREFDVNLFGVHRVTRAMFPFLKTSKGRIVMMGSDSGFFATPFFAPYCSSKFALEGYSDSLRRELLLVGIRVIIIQAGRISTPIWNKGKELISQFEQSSFKTEAQHIGEYAVRKGNTSGLPPVEVAKLVHKALSKKNPKTRYLIAPNTFKYRMIQILPDKVIDNMIVKEYREIHKINRGTLRKTGDLQ